MLCDVLSFRSLSVSCLLSSTIISSLVPLLVAGEQISGTSRFPGGARALLELNTAIHAIAREQTSAPSPVAGGANSRQDCGFQVQVEPLTLEVCLFDNGRRSSSSLAPPSSSSLLGIGAVVLSPIIVANGVRQGENRSNSRREVLLFEPGSGKPVASTLLWVTFTSHDNSYAPPTESSRIIDAANTCRERMPKVRKLSGVTWKPTYAIFLYQMWVMVLGRALDSTGLAFYIIGPLISSLQLFVRFSTASSPTGSKPTYFKIFDASEAIWALKAIFYAIDYGNAGFVPVEDIMSALSGAGWPQGTSPSDLPHLRQTTSNVGVTSEAHASEHAETLLNRLSRLGVGVGHCGGGCDKAAAQDDSARLVHFIRHLLVPPVSSLDATSRTSK